MSQLSKANNIVILPNERVKQASIELSKRLSSSYDTHFTVDGMKIFPHITLYQLQVPLENYGRLKAEVEAIASESKPFVVRMGSIVYHPEYPIEGFVFWDCERNPNLQALKKRVLEVCNPLRNGLIREGLDTLDKSRLTREEVDGLETYGSLVHYPFHITLSRLRGERSERPDIAIRKDAEFLADKISIGRVGEHGTVSEVLDEFKLGE